MSKLYGLIPAAGKGTRARPYTKALPKSMLQINGVPNLQRNIELMRDQLGITEIVIITGYLSGIIRETFGSGEQLGVTLHYIHNTELDKGLAWSILLGQEIIDDYFCVILSDECYVDSNHQQLKAVNFREAFAVCALKQVDDRELIRKNYAVRVQDDRITELIEKPTQIDNDILGCGTFVFSPEIFPLLEEEFRQAEKEYVEFVSFLDGQCREGRTVLPFRLSGSYVNINDRDSLSRAKFYERSSQFSRQRKALLIYSEGTEENVGFAIERYRKAVQQLDDMYLIVPEKNTIEQIGERHGIQIIRCPRGCDLYGEKIKYAFDRTEADILILTEADYAFPARDLDKLLAYMKEADMVVGTRTTRQMMEQRTDLEGPVRLANVFLAKLMELLWWRFEGRFTDVGCTFRAVWRTSYDAVRPRLTAAGPEFSAEMILEMLNHRMRVVEIPVNYNNVSRAMSARYRNIGTFQNFLQMLIRKRTGLHT
ncbi:MAG: sugar phosphate nucleotidyltransferase [Candidatus Electrothrix sp. YB6]